MENFLEWLKELLTAGSFSPLILLLESSDSFSSIFTNAYTSVLTFIGDLFINFFTHTLGFIVDSLFSLFDTSYKTISNYGIKSIDLFFNKFSLESDQFEENFIFFFIGLIFFAFFLKLCIKLFLYIIDWIKSLLHF